MYVSTCAVDIRQERACLFLHKDADCQCFLSMMYAFNLYDQGVNKQARPQSYKSNKTKLNLSEQIWASIRIFMNAEMRLRTGLYEICSIPRGACKRVHNFECVEIYSQMDIILHTKIYPIPWYVNYDSLSSDIS